MSGRRDGGQRRGVPPRRRAATPGSRDRNGDRRAGHLERRRGLTAPVDALIAARSGPRTVCRTRPAQHGDHDHVTGEVRHVLCSCRNRGLGDVRDDTAALRAAIEHWESACP